MIVSPSMSLVAAGVASGICFILFSTLRRGRAAESKRKPSKTFVPDDSRCACCLKPFLIDRGVQCSDCGARSCRKDCSRWDTPDNAWHCLFCHQRRLLQSWLRRNEKWFETFGGAIEEEELHRYFNTAKSRVYVAGVENAAASTSLEPSTGSEEETHAMEKVRDFVEKIVEGLIGSVDDAPIDRLYDHPAYDKLLGEYSVLLAAALGRLAVSLHLSLANKPSADPPTMAHTALRELVERAVDEARKLPGLTGNGNNSASAQEGRNIVEQSYEDLLATAILNKVIEKFQREQVDGNSNVLLGKSSPRTKCALSESELGLDEGVEEGSSSLEPLSQDECSSECSASRSRHTRNHQEPLSLTIEERIEEVTTTYTSDEDHRDTENEVLAIRSARRVPFPELGMDIIDPSQESSDDSQDEPDTPKAHMDMVSPIETWEENWLFQKKRAQAQPDAVAMLVPNSSADFKALIGDKDAEDTSDLSECSSAQSDEEIEKELMEAINNVVPKSPKHLDSEAESFTSSRIENPTDGILVNATNGVDSKIVENGEVSDNSLEILKMPRTNGDVINQKPEVMSNRVTLADRDVSANENKSEAKDIKRERSVYSINAEKDTEVRESISNGVTEKVDSERSEKELERLVENGLSDQTTQVEEAVSPNVPKTPTPTPTRISITENGVAEDEATCLEVEQVLSSLESAKMKLMDIDESNECVEENYDSMSMDAYQKHDFSVEDEAQQESEYTEHYDIATQRHMDSLTKSESEVTNGEAIRESASAKSDSRCREAVAFAQSESASYYSLKNDVDVDNQLATPPRPGTIAEREHKKWENAAPIENNPYSEESIQRRLWERQYSRRASDIPGVHTELAKSNGTELEVVLEPNQPDIKRFGRDYYINESKVTSGDRTRRSTTSISSRPSSSLSQRSNSTTAEQEQQDDTRCYKDAEPVRNRSNDVKSKVANWQKNNAEANRSQPVIRNSGKHQTIVPNYNEHEEYLEKNDNHRGWGDCQRVEDILENERKNSKNEINAKLNNQDTPSILETRKSFAEDNQRKIRRIDLKAYGFENEFPSNRSAGKTSSQRVVNKLDLKSFGYDGGLRRTQSNNHIDSTVNDTDFKPRIIRVTNKSNLSRYANDYGCREFIEVEGDGDRNLVKSTDDLNKIPALNHRAFGTMTSATSVPNIAKAEFDESLAGEKDDVSKECVERRESISTTESKETTEESVKSGDAEASTSESIGTDIEIDKVESAVPEKDEVSDQQAVEKIVKQLTIAESAEGNVPEAETIAEEENTKEIGDEKVPLPSVRRLAEAFSKQPEPTPVAAPRGPKANGAGKERSSTPEIHIVETPKQMHSLTARSLSKQFREGLRQIPNKINSPPASHGMIEQPEEKVAPETQSETVQSNGDKVPDDIGVISPGKLKSNIMFWEQMQRRT